MSNRAYKMNVPNKDALDQTPPTVQDRDPEVMAGRFERMGLPRATFQNYLEEAAHAQQLDQDKTGTDGSVDTTPSD